jgi:hypothetical protein
MARSGTHEFNVKYFKNWHIFPFFSTKPISVAVLHAMLHYNALDSARAVE